jgi:L-iditol 2-dehydrogenase
MFDAMMAIVRGGVVDVPVPTAAAGEVVIEVAYAGVCRSDLAALDGDVAVPADRVLGHECAGWLDGHPVAVIPFAPCGACACAAGARCERPRWLGVDRDGAFAERVAVPASCVVPLPAELALVHGAYVEPVAAALGVLPWIERGARVLVSGAGRIAELTARVVIAHGAQVTRVVLPAGESDEPATLRAPGAFDVAIEHDGAIAPLVRAVRAGGTVIVKSRARRRAAIDPGELVARDVALRGVSHGSFAAAVDWLHARRIAVADLLAPPRPLADCAAVFAAARGETHKQLFAIGAR